MAGRFKVKGRMPKFNINGFRADINKLGEQELKEATREWLREVIKAIPSWTGTARGTLVPLGRFLKVSVPNSARISNRKSKKIQGTTFQLGRAAGAQYGQDFDFTQSGFRFQFNYTINLPYIWWNSFGSPVKNLRNPTPWSAIQNGTRAFGAHIREEVPSKLRPIFSRNMIVRVI